MPNYLHRTTKEYFISHSPAMLTETLSSYIQDPDLSAVIGWDSKYWNITGDVVSLMTLTERNTVDAAEVLAANTEIHAILDAETSGVQNRESTKMRALIELFNKRDNYLVNRIEELQTALLTLQASSGNAGTRLNNLPTLYLPTATRTKAAAIQDYKDDINAGNQDI